MSETKLRPDFITRTSQLETERLNQLKAILPEAFADGKINFETLRQLLGDYVEPENDEEIEHFGLSWPGKRDARRLASLPSEGTLVPVPGKGVNEDTTHNLFIEGDNLEVLKLLQKSYAGRVKMIYIDPPYNTGEDFIYPDDFSESVEKYLRRIGALGLNGEKLTTNTKSSGRYHSNWLSMIFPRLILARAFLKEDGAIFVSIGDEEIGNLRLLMDEVFGEENFIAQIVWEGGLKNDSRFVSNSHDYILCYAKNIELLTLNQKQWRTRKEGIESIYAKVAELRNQYGNQFEVMSEALSLWYRQLDKNNAAWQHKHYDHIDEKGVFAPDNISWPGGGGPKYEVLHPVTNKPVRIPSRGWVFPKKETMEKAILEGKVFFGKDENKVPTYKRYLHETEGQVLPSVFYKDRRASRKKLRELFGEDDVFPNPKDEDVLMRFIEACTSNDDIILDFFAGSGTTAHAVMQLNSIDGEKRRFILVQIPELVPENTAAKTLGFSYISEITRARIQKVITNLQVSSETQNFGFKSFKLERSNFRKWRDYSGKETQFVQTLFDQFETPLVNNWTREKLLSEVLLIEGFPLDSCVTKQEQFTKNEVLLIESDFHEYRLWVCLDEKLEAETVSTLEIAEEDTFICLDSALVDGDKFYLADNINLRTI